MPYFFLINEAEPEGFEGYENLSDEMAEIGRNVTVKDLGFFIKPSELFCNIIKNMKDDDNFNETLQRAFKNFVSSDSGINDESRLKGLFEDYDVNSMKLGATLDDRNQTLKKIFKAISQLDLKFKDNKIDAFGDAYEFLMNMYAS